MHPNLRPLLRSEGDVEAVAAAGDLSRAVRHVKRHASHVLLPDPLMSGGSRIEAIARDVIGGVEQATREGGTSGW